MASIAVESNKRRAGNALSLRRLLDNEDVMKSLGPFLRPSRQGVLNELRRPSLVLYCQVSMLSFIEQAEEGGLWRVTHYYLGNSSLHPEVQFYRKKSGLSLSEFISDLFQKLFELHMIHREGNTGEGYYYVSFAEARTVVDYKTFVNEFKSNLVQWQSRRHGSSHERSMFCTNFDRNVPLCDYNRHDNFYLVLMQHKFSARQLSVSPSKKLGPKLKARHNREFARMMNSFVDFLRGDLLLQPSLPKVEIMDKLFPFNSWKDMIFSKY